MPYVSLIDFVGVGICFSLFVHECFFNQIDEGFLHTLPALSGEEISSCGLGLLEIKEDEIKEVEIKEEEIKDGNNKPRK